MATDPAQTAHLSENPAFDTLLSHHDLNDGERRQKAEPEHHPEKSAKPTLAVNFQRAPFESRCDRIDLLRVTKS